MPTSNIYRGAAVRGSATPTAALIYVDSDDNLLKMVPAGSGTTEVTVATLGGAFGAVSATSVQTTSFIKSSGAAATGGVGYSTGAGGAVTQITSRATGVTMVPNPCLSGLITTDPTSLAAEAHADMVVTNSAVAIGDVVVVSIRSGAVGAGTSVSVSAVTAGTFTIRTSNNNVTAGTAETGALLINFAIIKAVSA